MSETRVTTVPSDARAPIVRDLAAALDAAGVRYCHWKSNEKLLASVTGSTDLDILFEPGRRGEAVAALSKAGFIRFQTAWQNRYPGIEDFIGIDPESGRVVHVHAHFLLVVGETGLKSYHLPWEERILGSREWDETYGVWRSDAVSELFLLFVREAIKFNDVKRTKLRKVDRKPSGADLEYAWLKDRVLPDAIARMAGELLGTDGANTIASLYRSGFSENRLDRLQPIVTERLSEYRRYSQLGVRCALFLRRVVASCKRRAASVGVKSLLRRRVVDGTGLIVAFVGPDGSGKSTTVTAVVKELSRKVDVEHVYLGSGQGSGGLLRKLVAVSRMNRLGAPGMLVWRMALAIEKWARLRRIGRWRRAGKIMISDRYPQADVEGYNDGPLLARYKNSRIPPLRWIAAWERQCYARAYVDAPDILFRMQADLAVLERRRPKMKIETIQRKRDAIARFRFPDTTKVVDLNSGQPPETVARDALAEIGRVLRTRARSA